MQKDINHDSINNLSFIRTVLMLLVVLDHSMSFWTGEWFTKNPVFLAPPLGLVSSYLGSFHIYGFTLVSGYLFYYLKYEQGKYAHYIPFLKQKAKRLLVPFVFVAAVWVIPVSYLFFPFNLGEFVNKYILGTAPGQLWFLLMLFGVFTLFYPLSCYLKEHQLVGAVVVIGIYGVGLVGKTVLPNVFQLFTACMYLPIFWFGFKLRQWGSRWINRIPTVLWVMTHIILFALLQYISPFRGVIFTLVRMGLTFVLHTVGALMAFSVLQKIADKTHWRDSKIFSLISKLSFPVYLFHQQVLYILIYFLNGLLNPYAHVAVNFISALGISLTLSAILTKCRITRFLLGEK